MFILRLFFVALVMVAMASAQINDAKKMFIKCHEGYELCRPDHGPICCIKENTEEEKK